MENCGIEKSDHITWNLYMLPRPACYSQYVLPEVTEILDNEVTHPKKRNLLTRLI